MFACQEPQESPPEGWSSTFSIVAWGGEVDGEARAVRLARASEPATDRFGTGSDPPERCQEPALRRRCLGARNGAAFGPGIDVACPRPSAGETIIRPVPFIPFIRFGLDLRAVKVPSTVRDCHSRALWWMPIQTPAPPSTPQGCVDRGCRCIRRFAYTASEGGPGG